MEKPGIIRCELKVVDSINSNQTGVDYFISFSLIQCYLPIHDLLVHYPRRFRVSYLFLKTSNSRINKKKPPNSWIYKKKPTNSQVFLIILQ